MSRFTSDIYDDREEATQAALEALEEGIHSHSPTLWQAERTGQSWWFRFEYEDVEHHVEIGLWQGTIHVQRKVDSEWKDIISFK